MKFTCNQQILTKALNTVSKAVTSRTTIPILKGILLEVSDNQLRMAASDLDISIEKKINVYGTENGSVVVAAKLFSDIIRKLPAEEVEIEVEEGSGNVVIRCLSSEFIVVGQSADEFPNISEGKSQDSLSFNKTLLKEMIQKTAFCASIEEAKGIIVGVLINIEEDKVTMVSLDGFRMAVTKENMTSAENKKVVIAGRILTDISKIIGDIEEDQDIQIVIDEKKAIFRAENVKIVLRIMEGEFIKYKDIIPKEWKTRVKISRAEMMDSIDRASLLAKEGRNNLIKIAVTEDRIYITSRSEEGNVKEEVFCEREGENLEIGFNSKYIMDVLKVLSDEEVYMEFNSSVSPCLIKPVEGDGFTYLILPVRMAVN